MKRRAFITGSIIVFSAFAGGAAVFILKKERTTQLSQPLLLADALKALYSPEFQLAAQNQNVKKLSESLEAKGVLDRQGRVHHNVVLKLAKTDPIVVYNNRYYSQSEYDLYCLAYING